MRTRLTIWLVAVLLGIAIAGCGGGGSSKSSSSSDGGGGGDQPPPEPTEPVLVYPDADLLPPFEPIVIDFNFPMNPGTLLLASALVNHPSVKTWDAETGRTVVTITPTSRWPSGFGQSLNVYCEDASGYYYFEGEVAYDVPAVPTGSLAPGDSPYSGIGDQQAITVTFSEAVDPESLTLTGTLAPAAAISWSNGNSTLTITPQDFWPHQTDQGLQVAANTALYDELVQIPSQSHWYCPCYQFYSVSVSIPSVTVVPSGGYLRFDQSIVLTFSEAMNPALANFTGTLVDNSTGGTWSPDNTVLTFSPHNSVWPYGSLTLAGSVPDPQGDVTNAGGHNYAAIDFGSTEDQRISAPGPGYPYLFGNALAVSGQFAVIGATYEGPGGAAYVYKLGVDGWEVYQRLQPADAHLYQTFGVNVDIDGDTLIVGANGDSVGPGTPLQYAGAVYVYTLVDGVWTQQAKIVASDKAAYDQFGEALAVQGNTIAVGVRVKNGPAGLYQGAAYLFERDGAVWSETAILRGSDSATKDNFGNVVHLSNGTVVVGAVGHESVRGAAYVFRKISDAWAERAILRADDRAANDAFGTSLAIDSGTIVVGAAGKNAVYVFDGADTSWTQSQVLTASDPTYHFSIDVAIEGDSMIVGARYGTPSGAAYRFTRTAGTWSQVEKLTYSGYSTMDYFGENVDISGSHYFVGAPVGSYKVLVYERP